MNIRGTILLPKQAKILAMLGENIKMARLRRKLAAAQVAERAGISRRTLVSVEKGLPSVAMGIYLQVLFVLGLSDDLLEVAKDDQLGRKLQDAHLVSTRKRVRIPKSRIPEQALEAYFEKLKKAEYIHSFKAAAGDDEVVLMAEEGLEDYLKILDEE